MKIERKKLYEFDGEMKRIYEKISCETYWNTYKETYWCLNAYEKIVDFENMTTEEWFMWIRESIYELHNCDKSEVLEEGVGRLLVEFYKYDSSLGESMSMNNLGSLYQNGRLGKHYYSEAIKYYEMSDKKGCRLASENLGYTYYYGLGTEVDYERAYYYFSKAAMAGRYVAMYKIGDIFRYGYCGEKDYNAARDCYLKAEELIEMEKKTSIKEYGSVYTRLGDMYYECIGVDKDLQKAYNFYQKAQDGLYKQMMQGDPWHLQMLEHVENRLSKITRKFKKELPKYEWKN